MSYSVTTEEHQTKENRMNYANGNIERWELSGQELRDLKEGLRQSAAGETVDLGDFTQYAEEED